MYEYVQELFAASLHTVITQTNTRTLRLPSGPLICFWSSLRI